MVARLKLSSKLKKKINDRLLKRFQKGMKKIKPIIVKQIKSGSSPVANAPSHGQTGSTQKYRKYNKQYANKKKGGKVQPVTLTDSGRMLKSLVVRGTKTGVSLFFSNPLAKYHNKEGAGKSKVVRRMLPVDNEKFIKKIRNEIDKIVKKIVK